MELKTAADALAQFAKSEACQSNPRLMGNLKSALRRSFVFVYKMPSSELRKDLDAALEKMGIFSFLADAETLLGSLTVETFNQHSKRTVSAGTVKNYQSALTRFFEWLYAQGIQEQFQPEVAYDYVPQLSSGQTLAKSQQRTTSQSHTAYSLKVDDLPQHLKLELAQFLSYYQTSSLVQGQETHLSARTMEDYLNSLLCFLGWLNNLEGFDRSQLSLSCVSDIHALKRFFSWGIHELENSYGWAINIAQAAIAALRFLASQDESRDLTYQIEELQTYQSNLRSQYRENLASQDSDDGTTLSYEEGVQIIRYLRECCAPKYSSGVPRSETAILKAWQRYLIVGILFYCCIRQRELRQLQLNQLVIDDQDQYWLQLGGNNSKAKDVRKVPVPPQLSRDLDNWIVNLRPKANSEGEFVFTRLGSGRSQKGVGKPLGASDMSILVKSALYRATSVLFDEPKQINPQDLRSATTQHLSRISQEAQQESVAASKGLFPLTLQRQYEPVGDRYGLSAQQRLEREQLARSDRYGLSQLYKNEQDVPNHLREIYETAQSLESAEDTGETNDAT